MMAILQAVLALLMQQMGRVFNTAFGWATKMLFGQVPYQRQYYLSAIGLVSLLWLVLVTGVIFPAFGAYLLAFVSLPRSVNPNTVRLGMLIAALLLPTAVGGLSLLLLEPAQRPSEFFGIMRRVLKGYPYTLGLALTILVMIVVAPIIKLRDICRGWSNRHIPIVVESEDYFEIVTQMQAALRSRGYLAEREPATPLLRWPTRLFTFLAGSAADELVAKELMSLRAPNLEILLHPSDLVIRGQPLAVARAYAVISEKLAFTRAHFTWSKEARELEDQLHTLWCEVSGEAPAIDQSGGKEQIEHLKKQLFTAKIASSEWEVLFREILLVEIECLKRENSREHSPATDEIAARAT